MGSTQSTWECATSRPLYCHSSRPPARSSVSSWVCPTLLRKRLEKSRTSVPWTEMAWPLPSRSTTTCPAPPSPKGSTSNTKSRKMIWRSTPLRWGQRYARQVHHPQAQEGSHIPADVWRGISHVGSAMDLAFFGSPSYRSPPLTDYTILSRPGTTIHKNCNVGGDQIKH